MKTDRQGNKQPETLQDELRIARVTSQFFEYCRQAADRLDALERELEQTRKNCGHQMIALDKTNARLNDENIRLTAERDALKAANAKMEARLAQADKALIGAQKYGSERIAILEARVKELEKSLNEYRRFAHGQ